MPGSSCCTYLHPPELHTPVRGAQQWGQWDPSSQCSCKWLGEYEGQNVGTRPRGQQAVLACWVEYSSTNEIPSLGTLSVGVQQMNGYSMAGCFNDSLPWDNCPTSSTSRLITPYPQGQGQPANAISKSR